MIKPITLHVLLQVTMICIVSCKIYKNPQPKAEIYPNIIENLEKINLKENGKVATTKNPRKK